MPMNELFTEAMHAVEDAINSVPNDDGDQNDLIINAAIREVIGQAYNADWNLEDVVLAVRHHYHSIMRYMRIGGGFPPDDYVTAKGRPVIDRDGEPRVTPKRHEEPDLRRGKPN